MAKKAEKKASEKQEFSIAKPVKIDGIYYMVNDKIFLSNQKTIDFLIKNKTIKC